MFRNIPVCNFRQWTVMRLSGVVPNGTTPDSRITVHCLKLHTGMFRNICSGIDFDVASHAAYVATSDSNEIYRMCKEPIVSSSRGFQVQRSLGRWRSTKWVGIYMLQTWLQAPST